MSAASEALAIYRRSVLKQQKMREIFRLLGPVQGRRCLDLGSDNGIASLLLRRQGGTWASADLDPGAVEAIRALVGTEVYQLHGPLLPFEDQSFDVIVVVDYLEHLEDDRTATRELGRVIRPGGRLIVNVPADRSGTRLTRLRHRLGLTDAWHGHVRPGYTIGQLRERLHPWFLVERVRSYGRAPSEAVDTALNAVNLRQHGGGHGTKGPVITPRDLALRPGRLRLLSALYPVLWGITQLDHLIPWQPGYRLIVRGSRTTAPAAMATQPVGA